MKTKKNGQPIAQLSNCDICATPFEPKVYWQKHCSTSCKQAAWAINKAKKGKAVSQKPSDK